MRKPFRVFPRPKVKAGKTLRENVYYYYVYDETGARKKRSTGLSDRDEAECHCWELYKQGLLLTKTGRGGVKKGKKTTTDKRIILENYAEGFFDFEKSPYVKDRLLKNGHLCKATVRNRAQELRDYIIPTFGKKRMDEITYKEINDWMLELQEKKSVILANQAIATLRIVLETAKQEGYITKEIVFPKIFKVPKVEWGTFRKDEAQLLLDEENIPELWGNTLEDIKIYYINVICAITGMRLGEVLALRYEDLKKNRVPNGLIIEHNYNGYDKLKTTKNGKPRLALIPPNIIETLERLPQEDEKKKAGKPKKGTSRIRHKERATGYIFSSNGEVPYQGGKVLNALYFALMRIGIDEEQRKARRLSIRSWRHTFNTVLVNEDFNHELIRALMGHKSEAMTQYYNHKQYSKKQVKNIIGLQVDLLGENKVIRKHD